MGGGTGVHCCIPADRLRSEHGHTQQPQTYRRDVSLPALERANGSVGVSSASKETGGGGGGGCLENLGVVAAG